MNKFFIFQDVVADEGLPLEDALTFWERGESFRPGFCVGVMTVRVRGAPTYNFIKISKKSHKIEKNGSIRERPQWATNYPVPCLRTGGRGRPRRRAPGRAPSAAPAGSGTPRRQAKAAGGSRRGVARPRTWSWCSCRRGRAAVCYHGPSIPPSPTSDDLI